MVGVVVSGGPGRRARMFVGLRKARLVPRGGRGGCGLGEGGAVKDWRIRGLLSAVGFQLPFSILSLFFFAGC